MWIVGEDVSIKVYTKVLDKSFFFSIIVLPSVPQKLVKMYKII